MDCKELRVCLDNLKPPLEAGQIYIEGFDPESVLAYYDAYRVVRREGDRWEVFITDRGHKNRHRWFDSEEDACNWVFGDSVHMQFPTRIRTPEEVERDEAKASEIRERKRVEYVALLRSRGLDETGRPLSEDDGSAP